MDIIFNCSSCEQELAVDASGAGNEIQCPTCGTSVKVPEPTPENTVASAIAVDAPGAAPAADAQAAPPKEEKHFVVPQRATPTEVLIRKPKPTLQVAAKDGDRKIQMKTIRHSDCVEVGKDKFDDVVSEFLQQIGAEHIINISPVSYTHIDLATRQLVTDYAVMITFKG